MGHRAALVVVMALSIAVVGFLPAERVRASHGSSVNATAVWGNHQPGAENVSLTAYSAGTPWANDEGLEVWENFTTIAPGALGYSCTPRNVRAAGIDRDNDDPGTETDVSMLGKFKQYVVYETDANQTAATIEFYDPNDFGGESVYLNATDEILTKFDGCWDTPDEPGWYRNYGHTNGTNWDGQYMELDAYSHWYYFCDCDSYDEAVETLGKPPSVEPVSGDSDQAPGWMAGPYYVSEPRNPDGDGSSAATPTVTPEATPATTTPTAATPEATATPTATATATLTPTPAQGGRSGGGSSDTTTTPVTPTATATTTVTRTVTPAHSSTPASGPGFGVAVSLLALFATVLLGRRTR